MSEYFIDMDRVKENEKKGLDGFCKKLRLYGDKNRATLDEMHEFTNRVPQSEIDLRISNMNDEIKEKTEAVKREVEEKYKKMYGTKDWNASEADKALAKWAKEIHKSLGDR